MKKLDLLSNPTRAQVTEYYLALTLRQACQLFITSHGLNSERNQIRYLIKIMRDNDILPVYKNVSRNDERFHVRDFIYGYNHNFALNQINTLDEFENYRLECTTIYAELVTFLNQYLKDLLQAYGHETLDAFPDARG